MAISLKEKLENLLEKHKKFHDLDSNFREKLCQGKPYSEAYELSCKARTEFEELKVEFLKDIVELERCSRNYDFLANNL